MTEQPPHDNAPVLRSPLCVPTPSPLNDDSTITLETDQFRTCLLVKIPGHGSFAPAQLIACLEAQQALGQARADAAALEVRVGELLEICHTLDRASEDLARAAIAWAAAIREPNGVYAAEQALLAQVAIWEDVMAKEADHVS